jgi:hypothetical protein
MPALFDPLVLQNSTTGVAYTAWGGSDATVASFAEWMQTHRLWLLPSAAAFQQSPSAAVSSTGLQLSSNEAAFKQLCEYVSGCGYSAAPVYTCSLHDKTAIHNSGSSFVVFTVFVCLAIIVYSARELLKIFVLARTLHDGRVWQKQYTTMFLSAALFTPLAYTRLGWNFVTDIVAAPTTSAEDVLFVLHEGLLTSLPLLLVKLFFIGYVQNTPIDEFVIVSIIVSILSLVHVLIVLVRAFTVPRVFTEVRFSCILDFHPCSPCMVSTGCLRSLFLLFLFCNSPRRD